MTAHITRSARMGRIALATSIASMCSGAVLAPLPLHAQTAFDFTAANLSYSEYFNSMGTSGTAFVPGWTSTDATMLVSNGSSNTGSIYNVGTVDDPDRAFGSIGSGTTIPIFGASFLNNTGGLVTGLTLGGVMEQWRTGSNVVVETFPFEISFDATGLADAAATWVRLSQMDLVEKRTARPVPKMWPAARVA